MSEQFRDAVWQGAPPEAAAPETVDRACGQLLGRQARYPTLGGDIEAIRRRAEQYRGRARQLNDLAEAESHGRLRQRLADLARQYRELADSLLKAGD